MKRILGLVVCLCAAPAVHADELAPGRWQITSLSANGASATTWWVLKVDSTEGKTTATIAATNPAFKQPAVRTFAVKGDTVGVVLFNGFSEQIFNGRIAKDGKKVIGTLGTADVFYPAWLTPTELTELTRADMARP